MRRSAIATSSLVCTLISCASEDRPPPPKYTLCDGSDDIRATSHERRAGSPLDAPLTSPYGERFWFINGRCEYVVGRRLTMGIRHGVLDATQADSLTEALSLSELAHAAQNLTTPRDRENCLEGPVVTLAVTGASASCSCSTCSSRIPEAVSSAVADARWDIHDMLWAEAEPQTTPVELIVIEREQAPLVLHDWPFSLAPADVALDEAAWHMALATDGPYPTIELSAADSALARELRNGHDEWYPGTFWLLRDTRAYEAYVLDVMPSAWRDALTRFERIAAAQR